MEDPIESAFEGIRSVIENNKRNINNKHQYVKREVPAKKDWHERFVAAEKLAEEISVKMGKLKALRNSFWADVELSIDDYGSKRYNTKKNVIEILGDTRDDEEDNSGSVRSPFKFDKK